jgi:hypothetical protein
MNYRIQPHTSKYLNEYIVLARSNSMRKSKLLNAAYPKILALQADQKILLADLLISYGWLLDVLTFLTTNKILELHYVDLNPATNRKIYLTYFIIQLESTDNTKSIVNLDSESQLSDDTIRSLFGKIIVDLQVSVYSSLTKNGKEKIETQTVKDKIAEMSEQIEYYIGESIDTLHFIVNL